MGKSLASSVTDRVCSLPLSEGCGGVAGARLPEESLLAKDWA